MKRIYIAGPMTGRPELNFPAFHDAAAALRAAGHHVENPAEINPDPTAPWIDCMRADIARLVTCDAVLMLTGWQNSRGAMVEHGIAVGLGLEVLHSREVHRSRRAVFRCDVRYGHSIDVEGWELACGAVLHRTPFDGRKYREFHDDAWTVSDPVTGAAMARGYGMAPAVRAYRELVRKHGDAWVAVLTNRRKEYMAERAKPKAGGKKRRG